MTAIRDAFDDAYVPEPNSGCWIWLRSVGSHGYGVLWREDQKLELAHRFSFERARGRVPFGWQVLHRCDIRSCVNPDHLFVGTDADNRKDMARKERGTQKLSNAEVIAIRADKRSLTAIARDYGVSVPLIGNIRTGRARKYAGGQHGP